MPVPLNPEVVEEIQSLYERGWTKKAIAKKLNLHLNTVKRYTVGLERGRKGIIGTVEDYGRRLKLLTEDLDWVMDRLAALEETGSLKRDSCIYYDRGRGLCTVVLKKQLGTGFDREIYVKDGEVYRANAREYPGFCTACIYYKPIVEKK
jgi:hypothetical protein